MNKQEAAKYLGCSIRQVERYTTENKIGVRYERGRTRPTPVYDEGELQRFKEAQERIVHRPVVEPMEPQRTMTTQGDNRDATLSLLSQPGQIEVLSRIFAGLSEAANTAKNVTPPAPELGPKMLYTLAECQKLTGLSRKVLREAIEAGTLKAGRIGRSFKVRPDDLKKYLDSLF
jgi:excisionase family DNA binding protein